jgi:hypothetical protein
MEVQEYNDKQQGESSETNQTFMTPIVSVRKLPFVRLSFNYYT